MPTRVIREGLLDSSLYALLSSEAKLLYIHILLLADDFGCVGMSETFLRRRAFHDAPSGQKIAALVTELVNADLVRCYDAERACFAFIPKYRQRLQRQTLKHPMPPASLYQDDRHATELFNKYNSQFIKSTVGQPLNNGAVPVGQPPEVEVKKKKNISDAPLALPDWLPLEAWGGFVEYRKHCGKGKWSARAAALSLTELGKLRDAGHDPAAVLNQSVMCGYAGLFPPKGIAPPKRIEGVL